MLLRTLELSIKIIDKKKNVIDLVGILKIELHTAHIDHKETFGGLHGEIFFSYFEIIIF